MQAWRTFRPVYNADTCPALVLPELFYIERINELMVGVPAYEYLAKIASRSRKQKNKVSPASQLSFIIMSPTCKRLVLTFVG